MTVGETLRRERIRRNLDLKQVSGELKISVRLLEAMEAGDFEKLPGGVFARAFVRQYAQLLALDAEELAAEVHRQLDPQPANSIAAETPRPDPMPISVPRVSQWESVSDKRSSWSGWSSAFTALGTVVVVMLICSAVYAYWQRPRRTPSAPESVSAHAPAAVAQTTAAKSEPPAAESQPPAAEVTPTAAVVPTSIGTPEPAANAPRGAVHAELAFHGDVWMRADADGKYVFSGTMQADQSRIIDAENAIVLRLGNAGAVTITLNGKQLDPVGPVGQVRTVQLTSGGFQIVAPPKPASDSEPLDPL